MLWSLQGNKPSIVQTSSLCSLSGVAKAYGCTRTTRQFLISEAQTMIWEGAP